jgi:hypothetical protein
MFDPATTLAVLRDGDIEVLGRIVESSNNALLVRVSLACPDPEPPTVIEAIYKPTIGERPLDDFPHGTLTRREVAAWHVSEATGWGIVHRRSCATGRSVRAWSRRSSRPTRPWTSSPWSSRTTSGSGVWRRSMRS